MLATFTANLAAFLTVERMQVGIGMILRKLDLTVYTYSVDYNFLT